MQMSLALDSGTLNISHHALFSFPTVVFTKLNCALKLLDLEGCIFSPAMAHDRIPRHIVNLGSSFAAGPCVLPQIGPAAARRSGANYASLLSQRIGARLTDLSVTGATLLNMLSEPQKVSDTTFPPQVDCIPADADLVLILGGGNDLGYLGGIVSDQIRRNALGNALMWFSEWFVGSFPEVDLTEEALRKRYGAVMDAIHARVPRARILVIEYLTIFGASSKPGVDVALDAKQIEHHRDTAAKLQKATAKAVEARSGWCERVCVAEKSYKHDIGSRKPWVTGFSVSYCWGKSFPNHPNAEGMKAVADMLFEHLKI